MFGLEDLPFPVKLLIAIAFDILDIFDVVPGSDLIEMPVEGFLAYLLTDNAKAVTAGAIDGILPAPFDFFPTTTALVIADHMGWL